MQCGNSKDLKYQNLLIRHCNITKYSQTSSKDHLYMASMGLIAPPKILGPSPRFSTPVDTKAPLIYLVGLLAILNPHINICVGPPNT